jgi:tetratricopeptide (TPR) repeat protein
MIGCFPPTFALEQMEEVPLAVRLRGNGEAVLSHDKREPLMLEVVMTRPDAVTAESENQRAGVIREAYRAAGLLDKLSPIALEQLQQQESTTPVSIASFGSLSEPATKLVSFVIRSESGTSIKVPYHALKTMDKYGRIIEIDGRSGAYILYGIDPTDLGKLPDGRYTITATFDTARGATKTESTSNAIAVSLNAGGTDLSSFQRYKQDYLSARYWLFEADYERARQYARKLLSINPQGYWAWEIEGDALTGLDKLTEAREAYNKSLAAYQEMAKQNQAQVSDKRIVMEEQEQLIDRLNSVDELLRKRK